MIFFPGFFVFIFLDFAASILIVRFEKLTHVFMKPRLWINFGTKE